MEHKLEDYKYSVFTEVKYMGEWQYINEVWFIERKIGLRESKHLISYSEVEDIRG